MPSSDGTNGWRVFLLNACNSGYADVRSIAGPFSLIGAGYEHVPIGDEGQSEFAHLLSSAVNDASSDANCDGILSDTELQRALNKTLSRRPTDKDSNPIAVVRRQADADVPVVWLGKRGAHCRGEPTLEELLQKEAARALPCSLQHELERHRQLLRGAHHDLIESPVRYIAVDDRRACRDSSGTPGSTPTFLSALAARAHGMGFRIFRAPPTAKDGRDWLSDLGELATFTAIYRLTITNGALSLVSMRDGERLMTAEGDFTACDDASARIDAGVPPSSVLRLLRCLPRRVDIIGSSTGAEQLGCRERLDPRVDRAVSDECTSIDGSQTCLSVKVDGRFPTSDVLLVGFQDYLHFGSAAKGEPLDWSRARAVPCFSGIGQCFALPAPRAAAHLPGEWLLIERQLFGEAAASEETVCALQ